MCGVVWWFGLRSHAIEIVERGAISEDFWSPDLPVVDDRQTSLLDALLNVCLSLCYIVIDCDDVFERIQACCSCHFVRFGLCGLR